VKDFFLHFFFCRDEAVSLAEFESRHRHDEAREEGLWVDGKFNFDHYMAGESAEFAKLDTGSFFSSVFFFGGGWGGACCVLGL